VTKIVVAGGGAGGAAAVAELSLAGHEVRLWSRSPRTLDPFRESGGVGYEGIFGTGVAWPSLLTSDLTEALDGADVVLVCLPTFAHADVARALAHSGSAIPVVLNPGHTGGALEFRQTFHALGVAPPPIAEFSTLTYVARKYKPSCVTVTGRAKSVRLAALPGGELAASAGGHLFSGAALMPDVLACDLANVNMVLHVPGAVLGAAWIEATQGDFTFYVQGMTPGVARVMRALDDERRLVARAFGHDLPSLTAEMQRIGTVETSVQDLDDFASAIASGEANSRIKAPGSLDHRYYREDFGHGLLPFTVLAAIAEVPVPTAESLLVIGRTLLGVDIAAFGRTAERMGVAGMNRHALLDSVGAYSHAA
jgi:opine dehydrogenase